MDRVHKIAHHIGVADCKSQEQCNSSLCGKTKAETPKKPIKVCVTGAAGNIGYSIVFMIAQGSMLGPNQPIELRLLDITPLAKELEGVVMEIQDCASPVLTSIIPTTDYQVAFQDVEIALLIGAKPRTAGMDRKDLLTSNAKIFSGQGQALDKWAARNVKVLVVGNPANTNCLITMMNAPSLPKSAFTAMTRLDQNRAESQLASRARVHVSQVHNVVIWGNHSKTMVPDVNHGHIIHAPKPGVSIPIRAAVGDDVWLDGDFTKTVQDRGTSIIDARKGKSSAASAAHAALVHVRDWVLGTPQGEWVNMGILSDGNKYGVAEGIIYSFPCTCVNGTWTVVNGLKVNENVKKLMKISADELLDEKKQALAVS